MKLLCIDYGTKRVGLALSDPDEKLAFPFKTLYKTTRDKLFAELATIIEEESIQGIILGLPDGPTAADGKEALIVRQVKNFAESLERRFPLPVRLVDERWSSYEAEHLLQESGLKGKKLKEALDRHAAVRILETYFHESAHRDK